MVHRAHPPQRQSSLLQEGIGPPFSEGIPDRQRRPQPLVLRSGNRQVHADSYVFSDPPSQLRLGRQQYIVDQRRRRRPRRARVAQSKNVRGDRR